MIYKNYYLLCFIELFSIIFIKGFKPSEMKQPIENIRLQFEIRGIMTLDKMGMVL